MTTAAKTFSVLDRIKTLQSQMPATMAKIAAVLIDDPRAPLNLSITGLAERAMELRNRLQSSLGVGVPVDELLQGKSLAQLSEQVMAALPRESGRPTARAVSTQFEDSAAGGKPAMVEREEFSL